MSLLVCSGCSTRYASGLVCCPHCGSADRVEEGGGGSRLPYLDMVCLTEDCRAREVVRRVHQRSAAPGVLELPVLACAVCGAVMWAVGGWPVPARIRENMPKITRHGGASNAAEREHQLDKPTEGVEVPADGTLSPEITGDGTGEALPLISGGDEPSPGNSSATSAEKPPTSPETSTADPPKPARTTASRSSKGRTGSSTARSTATSTEADTS